MTIYFKDKTTGQVFGYDDEQAFEIAEKRADNNFEEIDAPPTPILPPLEIVVSPWQFRQALNELNLRASVETIVENTDNQDIKDGWEYALEWREFHPVVRQLAQALDLTEEEIHNIFVVARDK